MTGDRSPGPAPLNVTVRDQMRRMPRANTKPEVVLRSELHRRGLRFRIHVRDLPGRPDLALSRARLAVFVDGCFWHRCPQHGVLPKHNAEWWAAKLDANVKRDRRKDSELDGAGWEVVHVWEHEAVSDAANRIERLWRARKRG